MRLCCVLAFFFTYPAVYCQRPPQPLTHIEACSSFSDAIVQVQTDKMSGTGFIVGADGWIITAFHVVADPDTLEIYDHPRIVIGNRKPIDAEVVSELDKIASLRDFAILKVGKTLLPKLDLGIESNIESGSQVSIIGFPLSAMFPRTIPVGATVPKFCLTGTIAAQTAFPLGNLNFLHTVYFQGVSIKGISGAPIISLQTGKVIGVVSTKLTGIGPTLNNIRKSTSAGGDIQIIGTSGNQFGVAGPVTAIVNALDDQLANGLGSGTGASDVANALDKAKREYGQQHSKR
jgi:S1-C subfamily serine protease